MTINSQGMGAGRMGWAVLCGALIVGGCSGSRGAPGATGPGGIEGPAGPAGPQGPQGTGGKSRTLRFAPVSIPLSVPEKQSVLATASAQVDGQTVALGYQVEQRSGAVTGAATFGRVLAKDGTGVKNDDGSDFISTYSDFSSLLKVGSRLFEVTHFEALPAAMYLSELNQASDGKLSVLSTRPIDFAAVEGLWNPCAGTVSPWGTHLGSEEYPSDARVYETGATVAAVMGSASNVPMIRYWNLDPSTATVAQVKAAYNPYRYGYIVEVALDSTGAPTVRKHYAAGRRALELAYAMPDQKTFYLSDDGTNDAFYLFIARTAGDLSEGDLYAARWFQTSPPGQAGGRADLYWIKLGPTARDADVKALIDAGTRFSDIFDSEAQNTDGTCPSAAAGYRAINTDTGRECLLLKSGMELAASRLESRRYAAYLGATTEFRKTEGMTFNPEGSRLYVSFSEINSGMLDASPTRDLGGPNHVKLAQNYCGAVYELTIAPNPTLGSAYIAESARALVEGQPLDPLGGKAGSYPASSPYFDATATGEGTPPPSIVTNVCSLAAIANPDNISYIPGYDTLIIGEDSTDGHQSDALWAYHLPTRELTRILTSPYGAEVTGTYFYPNLNGHAYLKVQLQHPYGESDAEKAPDSQSRQSYVGYIGPLPPMD